MRAIFYYANNNDKIFEKIPAFPEKNPGKIKEINFNANVKNLDILPERNFLH